MLAPDQGGPEFLSSAFTKPQFPQLSRWNDFPEVIFMAFFLHCPLLDRKGSCLLPHMQIGVTELLLSIFLWLLIPFYFLASFWHPINALFPGCKSWAGWKLSSCSSDFRSQTHRCLSTLGLLRMIMLHAHSLVAVWWPEFWMGSWTLVLLSHPLLCCTYSSGHSEVPTISEPG